MPEMRTSLALPERSAVSTNVSHVVGLERRLIDRECCQKLTLESGLVTQSDLTRLHHKCETGVQGVTCLGLLLGGHLDGFVVKTELDGEVVLALVVEERRRRLAMKELVF